MILSYLGFAIAPGFVAIAGTRTADQVLRLATSRTSQELELSAVPPAPRARWKVLLRGLIYPAGGRGDRVVLFLIGPTLLHESTRVAAAAIAIAVVWAIAARIAAARFQRALAAPLGIQQARREDPRRIDLETLERWTEAAGGEQPAVAALARAALQRARVDPSDLADHLRHDEADVRAAMFAQLARTPVPALRGELRAALAIEDDDRALALGIKALTLAGDDAGIARGNERKGLSKELDAVTRSAALLASGDVAARAPRLARARSGVGRRDPARAPRRRRRAVARRRRRELPRPAPARCSRASRIGGSSLLPARARGRRTRGDRGDRARSASSMGMPRSSSPSPTGRRSPARSRRARSPVRPRVPSSSRSSSPIAIPRSRTPRCAPPSRSRAAARRCRRPGSPPRSTPRSRRSSRTSPRATRCRETWSACARAELEIATRRCVARLLWAFAVEAAAAGRDPRRSPRPRAGSSAAAMPIASARSTSSRSSRRGPRSSRRSSAG